MPPPDPSQTTTAPMRGITLYFDPGPAKVRSRYGWAGKFMPGHCFLCTACLSAELAEYPCPRLAQGQNCPIAKELSNSSRSSSVRVSLATTGPACRALLAESPHWSAAEKHVRKTLGENEAFAVVLCRRFCLGRWRAAVAEDEGGDKSHGESAAGPVVPTPPSSASSTLFPVAVPESATRLKNPAPPRRRRARDVDRSADLAPAEKRARFMSPDHTNPLPQSSPSFSTPSASSPLIALAIGHMQLQARMAHLEMLRTRLATRERMHALGYSKEEIDRALADSAAQGG
ncbi:hypothetical protein AMAG_15416 [Allomyces macrogynus ATCC 38327]|uniref:Uncharacterized protein n=1 Tax=Allomyces macrogynus (strain ATCC 38327) TaxID=578462 RepID=A0A0L0T7X7_ALLM3|nr:hypothetical protein AMAG_15416 [Allomyces macrogynus ATCC 38327]|eukprot:KNE70659.1 hypothetical protein AMAG_15416 [Allomyces macrogynus ATCC 38327]